jgi:hypothetical protein
VAIGSPHDRLLIGRESAGRLVIDARGRRLEKPGGAMEILEALIWPALRAQRS